MKQQLKLGNHLKQQQHLIISPQMQKALSLLQLPVMELTAALNTELEENPVLEYSEEEKQIDENEILRNLEEKYTPSRRKNDDDLNALLENTLSAQVSLFDHLMGQAREIFLQNEQLKIAELIIGNLDENGFLDTSLEEIALFEGVDLQLLESVLKEIQKFDPPGVAAKNLKESLLLQLKFQGKEKSLAHRLIENSFEEMTSNRLPHIAKKNGVSLSEIREAIEEEISTLVLHPGCAYGRGHYKENSQPIIPDIFIDCEKEGFAIAVNEKSIPPFRINPKYLNLLERENLNQETRDYIEKKIASGKWLLRNLMERQKTLQRIAEIVAEKQQEFFKSSAGNINSLTMKEIAEDLALHESTIARAVANKYVSSPRGLTPLRSFFTHAYTMESGESLSAPAVKELLQKIVREENPQAPLSDEALSNKMKEMGIPCARRTIAKYRHELGIGSRSERKRH